MLVDDERLVRAGLRTILESAEDLSVVAEAEDGSQVVAALTRHRPDVVLMDVRMPRVDGLEALRRVMAEPEPPPVVMLTTFDLDAYIFEALRLGASGFQLKDTPPRDLVSAMRVVARGEAMLSPPVTKRLLDHYTGLRVGGRADRAERAAKLVAELTPREREVLVEVARGSSNAQIGRSLFLSEATVKAHVSRVMAKLGVANRVQAALVGRDAGLLDAS
ncbi:MAG: response regulator [Catenulispora sp.]